jgi:hypothetical protein
MTDFSVLDFINNIYYVVTPYIMLAPLILALLLVIVTSIKDYTTSVSEVVSILFMGITVSVVMLLWPIFLPIMGFIVFGLILSYISSIIGKKFSW